MVWKTTLALLTGISSNRKSFKRNYSFLVILGFIAFFNTSLNAQIVEITPPTGGVNIDGDLLSNIPDIGYGDWFKGNSGDGGFVFNLTASLNPNLPTVTAVDPNLSKLFRDPYKASPVQPDNIFQSSKLDESIGKWEWTTGDAGGKGDIHNAMYHLGKDALNNQWIIVGGDRKEFNGTSYLAFEFFQNTITIENPTGNNKFGKFVSSDPGNYRTINDVRLAIDFPNGGTTAEISVYLWKEVSPNSFAFVLQPEVTGTAFAKPNVSLLPISGPVTSAPQGAFGSLLYKNYQFVEGAVNLTALLNSIPGGCFGVDINSMLVITKSSTAPEASLDDFIGPIQVEFSFNKATLDYAEYTPSCNNAEDAIPTYDQQVGGVFSTSSDDLVIDPSTGIIDVKNSKPGSYKVYYTYNSYTCTIVAETDFEIIKSPAAPTFTVAQPECGDTNGSLTIIEFDDNLTYTLSNADGSQTLTAAVSQVAPGTYTLNASNVTCDTDAATKIIINDILVIPSAAINNNNGLELSCFVTSTTLTASGGTTYAWTNSNGDDLGSNASITVSTEDTFTVTVTSDNGCSATTSVKTTLNDTVPADVEAVTADDLTCTTLTVMLSGSSTTADVDYAWTTSDGTIDSGADTATPTVSKAGTYTLTVTGPN